MKNKLLVILIPAVLILVILACVLCGVFSSKITAEGAWYSVEDAKMYNFKEGEITVAGVTVGQYEQEDDIVVISFIEDAKNHKLYITKLDGVEVLANVREGDGTVFFCRGLDNAEAMIKETEEKRKLMLANFIQYVNEHLVGEWVPIKSNADYKSIVISPDGTATFTKKNGDTWVQKLIINTNGTLKTSKVVMENRGYDSPTITLYMSNDGRESDINKMSVFACPETYSADYPALGFYGWTYRKEK